MANGERIRHFRKRMKMTQRYLGQLLGFPTNSADVRMAQYESEDRNPKADLTAQMASIFGVSPHAISVPDIDSYVGLMHTLFTLEDRYGLYVEESEGDVCLRVNLRENQQAAELHRMLYEWQAAAIALKKGEITQEAYDQWRYNFPDGDTTRRWVKVPSQGLMDDLVAGLQDNPDSDHE
ncbi:MAG: helix-turn-helix transcriptional regulator [Clostridia bacterium]|nr:helix-turn-helix transcriptional regulator [Clostridia bacterium]